MKNDSKLFSGSICISDLLEQLRKPHSAFTKSPKNDKIYANILIWENMNPDEDWKTISLQLNSTKEMKEQEGKIYIGNASPMKSKDPVPLTEAEAKSFIDNAPNDLPF